MSLNSLSLPVDIPWVKLASTLSMYGTKDEPFPLKWHSSLAVFYYAPLAPGSDDMPSNPNEATVFLKVVATITGFQPSAKELDGSKFGKFAADAIKNFDKLSQSYYPALSALIQVTVLPGDQDGTSWSLSDYPYLTDFEPKKRELVELVSDTGEALTQSARDLNVRKGTTSTNSTEQDNIDRGGSFGYSASAAGYGAGVSGSTQKEVGTKSTLGGEAVDIMTTDASREKRESFSHTTNLSQLYNLLDSYHAGTNRAVFFLNARPHLMQSPYTFVNGPRQLEGIQEFFLVVRRPKAMKSICVRAVLETAHLFQQDHSVTTGYKPLKTGSNSIKCENYSEGKAGDAGFGSGTTQNTQTWNLDIPSGYRLDVEKFPAHVEKKYWPGIDIETSSVLPGGVIGNNQYMDTAPGTEALAMPSLTVSGNQVRIVETTYGWAGGGTTDGYFSEDFTAHYIEDKDPEPITKNVHEVDLFITSREVDACVTLPEMPHLSPVPQPPPIHRPSPPPHLTPVPGQIVRPVVHLRRSDNGTVVFESEAPSEIKEAVRTAAAGGQNAAVAANTVGRYLRTAHIGSLDPRLRLQPGIDFHNTSLVVRSLLRAIDSKSLPHANEPLRNHVSGALQTQLVQRAPTLTVREALSMTPRDLARAFGLFERDLKIEVARALGLHTAAEDDHI